MDPAFTTALYVTLFFCSDGSKVGNGKCDNGVVPTKHTISILRKDDDKESLFEFEVGTIQKFVLRPDGSIEHSADFHVEDAALAFWQAVANTYKEACPDLSSVLNPLIPSEK